MKYFFKSIDFKIMAFIFALVSFVMLYAFFYPNNFFSSTISSSVLPFQKYVYGVSDSVLDFLNNFKKKEELEEEIKLLKTEINNLRDKTVDYNDIKRENMRFAKYYDFKQENNSLKFVPASVVGMTYIKFLENFTIDKGSDAGISVNDIVITENGVVGCVYAVNSSCCKVKSILSGGVKIGAQNSATGESGVICGNYDAAYGNLTRMIFIPSQNKMAKGDIIVTTGLSGMYPKNLKIGSVESIKYDDKEAMYYSLVKPFESMKDIRDVFVVTDFRGKGSFSE